MFWLPQQNIHVLRETTAEKKINTGIRNKSVIFLFSLRKGVTSYLRILEFQKLYPYLAPKQQ
jgi:hypothetical protein